MIIIAKLPITQHKRLVPDGTHANFCYVKTSFMLETISKMPAAFCLTVRRASPEVRLVPAALRLSAGYTKCPARINSAVHFAYPAAPLYEIFVFKGS